VAIFGLLARTNRSFCVFSGIFFGLLARTNRSFCVFSGIFFGLLPSTKGRSFPRLLQSAKKNELNALPIVLIIKKTKNHIELTVTLPIDN
jgi:hypothetical protein